MRLFTFAFLSVFAVSASADTIYNTFGVGDAYGTSSYTVNSTQSIATPFRVTAATTLTSLELPLRDTLNSATYAISVNQGGATAPGAVLTSWIVPSPTIGIKTLVPTSTVNLPVGDYYVVARSVGTQGGWFLNSISASGPFSFDRNAGWLATSGTTAAMRINASPVLEPASVAALGVGLAALARRRKGR